MFDQYSNDPLDPGHHYTAPPTSILQYIRVLACDTVRQFAGLVEVRDWLCANRLSLHIGKTNSMIVCNRLKEAHSNTTNLELSLDNPPTEEVNSLDYIGVHIDKHLVTKINGTVAKLLMIFFTIFVQWINYIFLFYSLEHVEMSRIWLNTACIGTASISC